MNDIIDPRDLYATLDQYLYNLFSRSLIHRSEIIPTKCVRPPTPLPIIDRSLLWLFNTTVQSRMLICVFSAKWTRTSSWI